MRFAVVLVGALGCASAQSAVFRPSPSNQSVDDFNDLNSSGMVLEVGSAVPGTLTGGDYIWEADQTHMQVWDLAPGWSSEVTIDLVSTEFDAFLWIVGTEDILTDDDGAGACNSRITFTPRADQSYRIIVNTLFARDTGKFTLSATRNPTPPDRADCTLGPSAPIAAGSGAEDLPTEGRVLRLDVERNGSISPSDPLYEGSYAQAWSLPLGGGMEVTIDMASSQFDTFLHVIGPGVELEDDDSGGACNSRVVLRAPETGEYRVIATAFSATARGEYSIVAREFPPPPDPVGCDLSLLNQVAAVRLEELTPEPELLTIGAAVESRLTTADELTDDDRFVKLYEFEGTRDELVFVSLTSVDFDTYLWFTGPDLDLWDDDGGGNCNAMISVVLPETGVYRIGASSFRSFQTGSFELRVTTTNPPEQPGACSEDFFTEDSFEADLVGLSAEGRTLRLGDEVNGELGFGDGLAGGGFAQAWNVVGEPGIMVWVELISTDFDSYLYAKRSRFLDFDDDSGGNCNAAIRVELGEEPTRIYVTSFSRDQIGDFRLRVGREPGPTEPGGCGGTGEELFGDRQACIDMLSTLPTTGQLRVDGVMRGELSFEDVPCADGTYLDAWTIDGVEGEELTFDLISREFDTYLYVTGPGLRRVLTDDDSGGACNARVALQFPQSGTYRAVASSFSEAAHGRYAIRVTRQPPSPAEGPCPEQRFDPGAEYLWNELPDELLATEGRRIEVGEVVDGHLDTGSPRFGDGGFVQAWELIGDPGAEVTIDLRSASFDAFLAIYGKAMPEVLVNNDGGEGTNARLNIRIPEDDPFVVIVVSSKEGELGEFQLEASTPK